MDALVALSFFMKQVIACLRGGNVTYTVGAKTRVVRFDSSCSTTSAEVLENSVNYETQSIESVLFLPQKREWSVSSEAAGLLNEAIVLIGKNGVGAEINLTRLGSLGKFYVTVTLPGGTFSLILD